MGLVECSLRLIRSDAIDAEMFMDEWFSLLNADKAFETFLEVGIYKAVFAVSELRD